MRDKRTPKDVCGKATLHVALINSSEKRAQNAPNQLWLEMAYVLALTPYRNLDCYTG